MYSLTYSSAVVMALGFIFQAAGVPFVAENAESAVNFVIELVGVIGVLWGRYRVGGVTKLGFKK